MSSTIPTLLLESQSQNQLSDSLAAAARDAFAEAAARLTMDVHTRDEIVSDSLFWFLKAWPSLHAGRGLRSYLKTKSRSLYFDSLRRNATRDRVITKYYTVLFAHDPDFRERWLGGLK